VSEIDKLGTNDTYGTLVEFLDWIDAHPDLVLAERRRVDDDGFALSEPKLVLPNRSMQAVIYEYLDIDAKKLEEERRELLRNLRKEVK